ncbi:polysaccharide biosynthesis protein [Halobacillus salinarum]|uniref:Polysaccharide biosynthesis protein n=1 Tax=Halobacillus salinarum TaxID=2932257 RepID=A0ABY4EI13_9BACI|nr:SDR family NAD(P)-dependent oxidoreductase [Halobacillus salinarum]UOQ44124.1 polysaccharide biosynthesis protein [Halobacillus salinarum]
MFFKDKNVLVIGGTGTIGRSIVKSLVKQSPNMIKIFSRDEYKQYHFQNELGKLKNVKFLLGDIRNYQRVVEVMENVDYVFHLAAMKHVTSCEFNPYEAVLTNVHGTHNIVKAATAQGVKKVVFTSSDKAINPANSYGATKLIAERLMTSEGEGMSSSPVFASVRFGNVMGSRGSVIPLFKKQIVEDRKITVTDRTMTRFMMTLRQATDLTMKALEEAEGGEVFVLKMPVILLGDLSDILIEEISKQQGLDPSSIRVEEIGVRPGEKMYEELMTYEESLTALELTDMYVIGRHSGLNSAYAQVRKAVPGTYSSSNETPIKKQELYQLLKGEAFI